MPKKILIVDDNKTVRTLLSINLRKENFEVLEAENGVEGLEVVNEQLPDLVISDIIMPQMDGFEFCKQVRTTSKVPMVPFMFLTSIDQVATELRGLRTGADDYLIKSNIKKEELVGKVQAMLNKANEYKQAEQEIQDGLYGKFSDLSLIDVLQLLIMNKKTGILTITRDGEKAELYFDDGRMLHAEYKKFVGEEAVYNLGEWKEGVFRFERTDVNVSPTIHTVTMNLLMEYCRITDEQKTR
ncbi:response regulator [bacterium]|nr:MAG: response regulator [bacterium]